MKTLKIMGYVFLGYVVVGTIIKLLTDKDVDKPEKSVSNDWMVN